MSSKKKIFGTIAAICILFSCAEVTTQDMTVLVLYYAFWLTCAAVAVKKYLSYEQ